MRASYTVTAGFTGQCPVTPRFVTQAGRAIAPSLISRVVVRADTGARLTIPAAGTSWLDCQRPVYRGDSLFSTAPGYSLQDVIVSGANIIQSGVERFDPLVNDTPTLTGYYYKLTIEAQDELFGSLAGTTAIVTLPDASVLRRRLGPRHAVTLNLPRGYYRVTVHGGGAIALEDNLRLSRDKTVDIAEISHSDLAALGGIVLMIGIGMPILSKERRKRLRSWIGRRDEEVSPREKRHSEVKGHLGVRRAPSGPVGDRSLAERGPRAHAKSQDDDYRQRSVAPSDERGLSGPVARLLLYLVRPARMGSCQERLPGNRTLLER
jgi:hypothetical protein